MNTPMSNPGIPSDDTDPLYLAALAVERDTELADEMAEWEAAMIDDGLTADSATSE
jgi:hypothetical protein